jgi:NAD(P)-dependent dehydrogenase (short-subunit alcohol dehydrogenase family)
MFRRRRPGRRMMQGREMHMDSGAMTGKMVMVTGPTSGIGLATAEALARQGASLVLAARNPEKAARVAERVQAAGAGSVDIKYFVKCAPVEPNSLATDESNMRRLWQIAAQETGL